MQQNRGRFFAKLICVFLLGQSGFEWTLHAAEPSQSAMANWVKKQMDDDRLTVEFYDPTKPPKRFPGWTDFEFRVLYRYDYQYAARGKRKDKPSVVEIKPKFTQVDIPVKNRTLLPNSLEGPTWFEKPLAKHELEHIKVGLHPRLTLLTRRLVEKLTVIEVPDATLVDVTPEWVAKRVDEAVDLRKDAIQTLVTKINAKIDQVTRHGSVSYPEWDAFLDSLYLKENLDEMKFPYLSEVLDIIESREYKMAQFAIPEPDEKALPAKKADAPKLP